MTPKDKLKGRVEKLLDGSLGLSILPSSGEPTRSSIPVFCQDYRAGFQIGALYALAFCAVPWLVLTARYGPLSEFSRSLFFLQIYGSLWCGWATASTRMASSPILKTVEKIIPELSENTAEAIYQELTQRFDRARLLYLSWDLGIICAVAASTLVYYQTRANVELHTVIEIIWWSFGWWILFTTAAKVVNVGSFYRVFATQLEDHSVKLYPIDPANSPLVINIASIGRTMLWFWLGIAVSIAAIVPFAAFGSHSTDYSSATKFFSSLRDMTNSSFVSAMVPITGFFSIGLGTIVFLRSEAAIRRAVKKTSLSTLRLIETEIGRLADLRTALQTNLDRIAKLKALHQDVATAGSYRSLIVSGLSLLLPFIPLVSLVKSILSWLVSGTSDK